jgi:Spy/CpxP family protein refolding chaperone
MKLRFFLTALVAVVSICAFAQGKPPTTKKPPAKGQNFPRPGGPAGGPGGGMGMRRGMPDELKKQLKLTPAQEKKLDAIRKKYEPKFKALFDANKGKMPDRTKMRALFEAQRKETDAVFTAKQKEILKKWRETHRRGGPGASGRPGGPSKGGPPKAGGKSGG